MQLCVFFWGGGCFHAGPVVYDVDADGQYYLLYLPTHPRPWILL